MTDSRLGPPVIVGIDGSRAAVHAAEWAIDEAIARGVSLRLVHVAAERPASGGVPLEIEYAETVMRQADAAIQATGKTVEVETAIVRGDPAAVFLAESLDAELICIGSSGVGVVSRALLGSTVTTLAEGAHCPVAIIRHRNDGASWDSRWIVVAVKASIDDEEIVMAAMEEARLRHSSVLAVGLWQADFGFTPYDEVDRLVDTWRQRFPDVRVCPASTRSGLVKFLNDEDTPIGLVVVGADEARHVAQIIGPHDHPIMGHPECSVLIVRH